MLIWISPGCPILTELLEALSGAAAAMSVAEVVAVGLAIAYLLLAIRQSLWCWPAAICSAAIYIVLMFNAGLYMESALQFFYIGMAVYGWVHWAYGGDGNVKLPITDWPLAFNVPPLALMAVLTLTSGGLLDRYSDAAYPYADSFTTWAAMITTWMVARKVLQNWHYWFVIDAVSVYLFWQRELYLTALLFLLYLVLIIVGYRAWRADLVRARG